MRKPSVIDNKNDKKVSELHGSLHWAVNSTITVQPILERLITQADDLPGHSKRKTEKYFRPFDAE